MAKRKKEKICCCVVCNEMNYKLFYIGTPNKCKSCVKEWQRNNPRTDDYKQKAIAYYQRNIIASRIYQARKRATLKGWDFNLTVKEIKKMIRNQKGKCCYSGIKFDNMNPLYSISVDRINSKLGYTMDNIQLVCSSVNMMKQDLSEGVFLDFIEAIYDKSVRARNLF